MPGRTREEIVAEINHTLSELSLEVKLNCLMAMMLALLASSDVPDERIKNALEALPFEVADMRRYLKRMTN